MNTQYNVAVGLVEDFWGDAFWSWIGNGPAVDAEAKEGAEAYVDHLDWCISAIIEGDEECYTPEESEYIDSMPYEAVELKYNYQFMSDLNDWMLNWVDNDELLEGIDKLLMLAKLSKEAA
jgi:hypothetical protein